MIMCDVVGIANKLAGTTDDCSVMNAYGIIDDKSTIVVCSSGVNHDAIKFCDFFS